jgi:hypothetical protein
MFPSANLSTCSVQHVINFPGNISLFSNGCSVHPQVLLSANPQSRQKLSIAQTLQILLSQSTLQQSEMQPQHVLLLHLEHVNEIQSCRPQLRYIRQISHSPRSTVSSALGSPQWSQFGLYAERSETSFSSFSMRFSSLARLRCLDFRNTMAILATYSSMFFIILVHRTLSYPG